MFYGAINGSAMPCFSTEEIKESERQYNEKLKEIERRQVEDFRNIDRLAAWQMKKDGSHNTTPLLFRV